MAKKYYKNQSEFVRNRKIRGYTKHSKIKKQALYTVAVFLLILINIFKYLKDFLLIVFSSIVYKPTRKILKWFFYKVVVKVYTRYNTLLRRIGWTPGSGNVLKYVFNQRLVHIVVIFLTLSFVFLNLTNNTRAGSLNETAGKTVIASLLDSEFGSLEEEQLVEEFFNYDEIITPTQQNYLDNLSAFRPQANIQGNYLAGGETENDSAIPGNEALLNTGAIATEKTIRPRDGTVTYVVEAGDSVSTIARKFGVSVSTVLWENNLTAYSYIRPGDELAILPQTGLTHKVVSGDTIGSISNKYDVEPEDIYTANKITSTSKLSIGQKLMIPGGIRSVAVAPAKASSYSGLAAIKDLVVPSPAKPAANKMNWPTEGARITQYYSWRHTGLDIANKVGTPIYAADSGTIEVVGWGTGYGNQILINHGGGKKTRYAHLSKFYVEKGDTVEKGEAIGAMGNTGWSTGSHLHFEVIINNVKYNPLNYIK